VVGVGKLTQHTGHHEPQLARRHAFQSSLDIFRPIPILEEAGLAFVNPLRCQEKVVDAV